MFVECHQVAVEVFRLLRFPVLFGDERKRLFVAVASFEGSTATHGEPLSWHIPQDVETGFFDLPGRAPASSIGHDARDPAQTGTERFLAERAHPPVIREGHQQQVGLGYSRDGPAKRRGNGRLRQGGLVFRVERIAREFVADVQLLDMSVAASVEHHGVERRRASSRLSPLPDLHVRDVRGSFIVAPDASIQMVPQPLGGRSIHRRRLQGDPGVGLCSRGFCHSSRS